MRPPGRSRRYDGKFPRYQSAQFLTSTSLPRRQSVPSVYVHTFSAYPPCSVRDVCIYIYMYILTRRVREYYRIRRICASPFTFFVNLPFDTRRPPRHRPRLLTCHHMTLFPRPTLRPCYPKPCGNSTEPYKSCLLCDGGSFPFREKFYMFEIEKG